MKWLLFEKSVIVVECIFFPLICWSNFNPSRVSSKEIHEKRPENVWTAFSVRQTETFLKCSLRIPLNSCKMNDFLINLSFILKLVGNPCS